MTLNTMSAWGKRKSGKLFDSTRREQTGPDGGPIPQNTTVKFVDASLSPENAYRRMVDGPPLASCTDPSSS